MMLQPWVYSLAEALDECDVVPKEKFLAACDRAAMREQLVREEVARERHDARQQRRRRFFRRG